MRVSALAVVAACALSAAAPASAQQTIKIGELNSYKSQPAFLDPYKKGWEMAVDEINAAGGVLGKKLEIVSRDDGANPGDAVRVAEELTHRRRSQHSLRHVSVQCRPCRHRIRRQEESVLSRRRAADRQDHLGERQPLHLPAAALDLHAGGNAAAGRARGEEKALGAGLSEFRIRTICRRRLQGTDEGQAAGRGIRYRAGVAARQDRCRRGGAGDRRRQAGRDFQRAVCRRSDQVRARGHDPRHVQGSRRRRSARAASRNISIRSRTRRRPAGSSPAIPGTRSTRRSTRRFWPPTRNATTTIRASARSSVI